MLPNERGLETHAHEVANSLANKTRKEVKTGLQFGRFGVAKEHFGDTSVMRMSSFVLYVVVKCCLDVLI